MAAVVVASLAAVAAVAVTTAAAVAVVAFTAAAVVGRTAVVAVVAPTAVAAVVAVAADRIDNPKFLTMPARPEVPGLLFVFQSCALLPAGSFLAYKLGVSRELAAGSFTTLFVAGC